MKQLALQNDTALTAFITLLAACFPARPVAAEPTPWRAGWGGIGESGKTVACAKEIGFTALITHAPKGRMASFAELCRENGLECYYWFSLTASDEAMASYKQVMSQADDRRFAELKADEDPRKHGYQFGGEPVPGRHEVLLTPLLCFHRVEVAVYARRTIREMLEACPALTGVAFDYFGYQNYRCCYCPQSTRLFEAYQRRHPDLSRDEALGRFSLDTLVQFNNDLAAYIRSFKPKAKIATHVYPVFLPEPLYGNRLSVDYCCQTVAWFFEPYWTDEKVRQYTRTVVEEQNRFHARQRGIPFVGVYVDRPMCDKPAERLAHELRLIREASGGTSFSTCTFGDFVKHEAIRRVAKEMPDADAQ